MARIVTKSRMTSVSESKAAAGHLFGGRKKQQLKTLPSEGVCKDFDPPWFSLLTSFFSLSDKIIDPLIILVT